MLYSEIFLGHEIIRDLARVRVEDKKNQFLLLVNDNIKYLLSILKSHLNIKTSSQYIDHFIP